MTALCHTFNLVMEAAGPVSVNVADSVDDPAGLFTTMVSALVAGSTHVMYVPVLLRAPEPTPLDRKRQPASVL